MINFTEIIASSLAISASLAWNEFFKSAITEISPIDTKTKTVLAYFVYAIFITIMVYITFSLIISVRDKVSEVAEIQKEEKVQKTTLVDIDPKLLASLRGALNSEDNTPSKSKIVQDLTPIDRPFAR